MCSAGYRIRYNILRIITEELPAIKSFYEGVCGMVYEKEEHPKKHTRHIFTFPWQDDATALAFEEYDQAEIEKYGGIVRDGGNPGYWKVGFAVQDVNAAKKYIESKTNLKVGNPMQFLDVGYLTSFKDPVGYSIELLQHTFEINFKATLEGKKTFLGQPKSSPPVLGQITIRCKDPIKTCDFYTNILGMKLPVIIPVCIPGTQRKFTLFFFAYNNANGPDKELMAIENREWLWQQTFTQIEIQHVHGNELLKDFKYISNDHLQGGILGHGGYQVVVTRLTYDNIKGKMDYTEIVEDKEMTIQDPDGFQVEVLCN